MLHEKKINGKTIAHSLEDAGGYKHLRGEHLEKETRIQ